MARVNAGLTQQEVADRLGTHKTAISRIENHGEDIRLSTLEKYAEALVSKPGLSAKSGVSSFIFQWIRNTDNNFTYLLFRTSFARYLKDGWDMQF